MSGDDNVKLVRDKAIIWRNIIELKCVCRIENIDYDVLKIYFRQIERERENENKYFEKYGKSHPAQC